MYTSEIHKIYTRVFDNCYHLWYVCICVCIDVCYCVVSCVLSYVGLWLLRGYGVCTTEFYSIYKYAWDKYRPTWDALSPNINHAQANYKNS